MLIHEQRAIHGALDFLHRRDYDFEFVNNQKDLALKLSEENFDFVFVSLSKKVIAQNELNTAVLARTGLEPIYFIEHNSIAAAARLDQTPARFKLFPPLSGPTLYRHMRSLEEQREVFEKIEVETPQAPIFHRPPDEERRSASSLSWRPPEAWQDIRRGFETLPTADWVEDEPAKTVFQLVELQGRVGALAVSCVDQKTRIYNSVKSIWQVLSRAGIDLRGAIPVPATVPSNIVEELFQRSSEAMEVRRLQSGVHRLTFIENPSLKPPIEASRFDGFYKVPVSAVKCSDQPLGFSCYLAKSIEPYLYCNASRPISQSRLDKLNEGGVDFLLIKKKERAFFLHHFVNHRLADMARLES